MESKILNLLDKNDWPDGPWKDEPDVVYWIDEVSGLECLIIRNEDMGNLNGYVIVSEGHPAYGGDLSSQGVFEWAIKGCFDINYNADEIPQCAPDVAEWFAGRKLWVYGFDCGHAMDLTPGRPPLTGVPETDEAIREMAMMTHESKVSAGATYKDLDFVKEYVLEIARKLARVGRPQPLDLN